MTRNTILGFVVLTLVVSFPNSASAQTLCNCDEVIGGYGTWEHQFTNDDVDWGFEDGHANPEGGRCATYHVGMFCEGMAMNILEASDTEVPAEVVLSAFAERMHALPAATPEEVSAFVNQFRELARLSTSAHEVLVDTCTGTLAFTIPETVATQAAANALDR